MTGRSKYQTRHLQVANAAENFDEKMRTLLCAIGVQAVTDLKDLRHMNVLRRDGTINPAVVWFRNVRDNRTGKMYHGERRFHGINHTEALSLQWFIFSPWFEKILEMAGILVSAEEVRRMLLKCADTHNQSTSS